MLLQTSNGTPSVLRGVSEVCCCEVLELSSTGASLKLSAPAPRRPVLLSFRLAGEHVMVPITEASERRDGRVAVSFGAACEHRLERLLALAA